MAARLCSHVSPACSHCLLGNPETSTSPWNGSYRTRPSRIFLFFSLDLFILHSLTALLSCFRFYFDISISTFRPALVYRLLIFHPSLGFIELSMALLAIFSSFRICVPVLRDSRSCDLETLLILRLIFTSSPLKFSFST